MYTTFTQSNEKNNKKNSIPLRFEDMRVQKALIWFKKRLDYLAFL
jgi:hypothetical protein